MNIYVYAKTTESTSQFDILINIILDDEKYSDSEIFVSIENRRSFRELEKIKNSCKSGDIVIISNISVLGINDADIANSLDFFKTKETILLIKDIPSTYEYGIGQPMNQAVISTLLQSLLDNNKKIRQIPSDRQSKSNAGRSRIEFPENWDELYGDWESKKITSKEFIEKSGLKKATFYNMITEYREIQKLNSEYIKRYSVR